MIIGKIHPGSGLGDQLFSYITTRTIALDKGYDFGFVGKEYFKGKDFMNLDWGKDNDIKYYIKQQNGELEVSDIYRDDMANPWHHFKISKPYYDPEVNFIEDGTVVDACCAQDERYFGHRLDEIRQWLKVEPLEMPDDLCVINFRGGEFVTVPELFLPKEYWEKAMDKIADYNNFLKDFQVETDDTQLAAQFFPEFPIRRDIALNWRSVRYAKHLILSNSAFGIIPALLNENVKEVIAPRYHARRNIKQWSMPSNYYKKFLYI